MHHKWQSYDVRFLRYEVWQAEFFVILDCFLPFYRPNNSKNQNFEKLKKTPEGIIILHMRTINDSQMMYGSWDIGHDRIFFFCHFRPFFAHLPPKNPKNQNFEEMKKTPGDIIILHMCNKNQDHMLYCSWDMAHDRCNFHFSFWTIFCPFTP